jgi:hypothetical protein
MSTAPKFALRRRGTGLEEGGRTGARSEGGQAANRGRSNRGRPLRATWAIPLTLSIFLLAPIASSAAEEPQTRESYSASVEPICQTNKTASDKYLKGVRALVTKGRLKPAAERFTKAAAALERAQRQLAAVPQPPADADNLARWLAGIKGEVSLMRTIAAKLRHGERGKASSISVKLTHNATTTNNQVIAFEFDYCHIDPSKYT